MQVKVYYDKGLKLTLWSWKLLQRVGYEGQNEIVGNIENIENVEKFEKIVKKEKKVLTKRKHSDIMKHVLARDKENES